MNLKDIYQEVYGFNKTAGFKFRMNEEAARKKYKAMGFSDNQVNELIGVAKGSKSKSFIKRLFRG